MIISVAQNLPPRPEILCNNNIVTTQNVHNHTSKAKIGDKIS